jgi:hypothetical protein
MATDPRKRQAPKPKRAVIGWLLDSDPSIRWQVMRDLTDAPADEVAAERARVATEGWGARLLALQAPDGRWGGAAWTRFAFPTWWHYDVLRGLEYLRSAGVTPDERVAEAIELVASKRDGDGRWPLEARYPGVMPVEMDEGEGRPSRWITLRALRVLDWYAGRE